MLLGIDVGGTYTDAVLVEGTCIFRSAKAPTNHDYLLSGILEALDKVMAEGPAIDRVVLSTTIVTNAIVQGKTANVGLVVIPGPGVNITEELPGNSVIVEGYIDHRGREVQPVNIEEVNDAIQGWLEKGITAAAVVGKFSVRNPKAERQVAEIIREKWPQLPCICGHRISGNLNFPRRINSAYLNAAVYDVYRQFAAAVNEALRQRNITAPVFVLKADGGTMPMAASLDFPVETIFTGPAASVLGVSALTQMPGPAAMLDIGGTTTDIALWRGGVPLMSAKGARVNNYLTHVRSFLLKSVGIGGDSEVRRVGDDWLVGPERKGPAAALGGSVPTPTDAMLVLGRAEIGDKDKASQAIARLCKADETVKQAAEAILMAAAAKIVEALTAMIREWEDEPVYRIQELLASESFDIKSIIGVGGAAGGLVPLVGGILGCKFVLPAGGMFANAIGAAVARPTMMSTLRADTEEGYYTIIERGERNVIKSRPFGLSQARQLAATELIDQSKRMDYQADDQVEVVYEEEFNLVRGFYTVGKIITSCVQLKPGIMTKVHIAEASQAG